MRILCIMLSLLLAPLSHADNWRTDPLTPTDQLYMDQATDELNDIARIDMGRSFGGGRDSDIRLIQDMLDRRVVASDNTKMLQAMGIVLGEHLQKEQRLEWVIYSDKLGRSRALEVPMKEEFIFPVTQISSRAAVGADIDVAAIYQKLEDAVARAKKKIIVR